MSSGSGNDLDLKELVRENPEDARRLAKRAGGAIEDRLMRLLDEVESEVEEERGQSDVSTMTDDSGKSEPDLQMLAREDPQAIRSVAEKAKANDSLALYDYLNRVVKDVLDVSDISEVPIDAPSGPEADADVTVGDVRSVLNTEQDTLGDDKREEEPVGVINPSWRGDFVYVIRSETGMVKIGRSKNPKRRLDSFQTGNHEELVLFAAAGVENPTELEKKLHYEFQDRNERGEWFELSSEMLQLLVRRLKSEADAEGS